MKTKKKYIVICYIFTIFLIAYLLKIYRFNKTEIIKCTNCYSFKDQWNNIKNNSSINKNAKVFNCWLQYDNSKSKPCLQVMFITQNKFGRFQYVDAIYENDKIKLDFNGTGKNLENEINNRISTDDFMDKLDIVFKNRHKLFKTSNYKYSIFTTAKYSDFITKRSNAYSIDQNGVLTKIPEKDFPLKNVIYMHCEKLDEKDSDLEDICIIFK